MLTAFSYLTGYMMKLIIFAYGFYLVKENTARTQATVDAYNKTTKILIGGIFIMALGTLWCLNE